MINPKGNDLAPFPKEQVSANAFNKIFLTDSKFPSIFTNLNDWILKGLDWKFLQLVIIKLNIL